MKLRIAQVTNLQESVPPVHQHGLEQVVFDLTEELVKMGHEVTLFATADSRSSAKVVPIWPNAIGRDPYSLSMPDVKTLFTKLVISRVFQMYKEFDIIHDHSRFFAPYFADLIPTPIVSTIHHPISYILEEGYTEQFSPQYKKYFQENWEAERARVHTVVVSKFQAKKYPGTSHVIYNGLPLREWKLQESPGEYLAFLGYIAPDKGTAEAIQAVLPTNEKLMIAGPTDESEFIQAYFKERIEPFLNERIQYVGPANFQEKMKLLSGAKAILMPIQWDEPFGLVAIESMACGTPVIAWDRAAMPEIVVDGETGYLVKSVTEMTKKISQIPALSRRACRERVERDFSAAQMAKNYVELYQEIIRARPD